MAKRNYMNIYVFGEDLHRFNMLMCRASLEEDRFFSKVAFYSKMVSFFSEADVEAFFSNREAVRGFMSKEIALLPLSEEKIEVMGVLKEDVNRVAKLLDLANLSGSFHFVFRCKPFFRLMLVSYKRFMDNKRVEVPAGSRFFPEYYANI